MWLPLKHPLPGTWPANQACAPPGNQTSNFLLCKLVLNPLSHQPRLDIFSFRRQCEVLRTHGKYVYNIDTGMVPGGDERGRKLLEAMVNKIAWCMTALPTPGQAAGWQA